MNERIFDKTIIRSVLIAALSSMVITLGVFYLGYGRNTVTKDELRKEIDTSSPWIRDRPLIVARLDAVEATVNRLAERDINNEKEIASIEATLAQIESLLRGR